MPALRAERWTPPGLDRAVHRFAHGRVDRVPAFAAMQSAGAGDAPEMTGKGLVAIAATPISAGE